MFDFVVCSFASVFYKHFKAVHPTFIFYYACPKRISVLSQLIVSGKLQEPNKYV